MSVSEKPTDSRTLVMFVSNWRPTQQFCSNVTIVIKLYGIN